MVVVRTTGGDVDFVWVGDEGGDTFIHGVDENIKCGTYILEEEERVGPSD